MAKKRDQAAVKIQNLAKEIFLSRGYTKTTMREIAAAANLSPAAIYNYFPSKKKLFDSLSIPQMEHFHPEREQRRETIITVALEQLCIQGFDKLKMDDIALAAGISKPTLYQYFNSKEELLITALREAPASLVLSRITEVSSPGTDLRKYIKDIGSGFALTFDQPERRTLLHTIITESVNHPEIGEGFFNDGPYVQYDIITNYFRNKKKCDEATIAEIRRAFIVFWGSLQAYIVFFRLMGGVKNPPDWDEYLDTATTFFCDHMAKLGITTL